MRSFRNRDKKLLKKIFGKAFSLIFTTGVTLGLLSVLSAMILTGPRVYYTMARDGIFFKIFSKVNPYTRTPVFSILLQASIAIFMLLTSSFETLLLYIGFTLSICSSLTVGGLIKINWKVNFFCFYFYFDEFWDSDFYNSN